MSLVAPSTNAPARHSALATDEGLECPSCASVMMITPNPYYGTGMAEHRNIALCKGCHNIAFMPEAAVVEEGAGERFAGRMRSLFRLRQ